MGVHINTDNLSDIVIPYLKQCKQKIKDCKTNLKNANKVEIILPGLDGADGINNKLDKVYTGIQEIIGCLENNLDDIKSLLAWIKDKINSFETAESNSRDVSDSIAGGVTVSGISASSTRSESNRASVSSNSSSPSINSGSRSANSTSAKVETEIGKVKEAKQISSKAEKVKSGIGDNITDPEEMQKVIPDEPTETAGIIGDAIRIEMEPEETNTEVETIIDMIYGNDAELTEEEKQTITNAVENIDKTEILNNLNEETANQIKSQIIKAGMDNQYDLTNITAESLQQYIAGQPSLNVQFELNEATQGFSNLINEGSLTQEQLDAVVQKIQIYETDEEFLQAYQNAGGTESDITNVQVFYDEKTGQINMRNTADASTIADTMIYALDKDNLFYDEITQQVSYDHSANGSSINEKIRIL